MTTMQAPQAGVIVLVCDPKWSPCQKLQAKAKADKMNQQCPLTRRPGISADDGAASSLRELGNAAAKAFKSHLKQQLAGKSPKPKQWLPPKSHPKGDGSDLMHPCMEKELKKSKKAIDGWSADHVKDLQWGGAWHGPLQMLDMDVNESLGRQMNSKQNKDKDVATGVTTQGC